MSRRKNPFPNPRQHKGAAVVDIYDGPTRRTVTLGPWGSEQAQLEYERLLVRLRAGRSVAPVHGAPAPVNAPADLTVAEALVKYVSHVEGYYRNPDGTPTGTAEDIKITLRYLQRFFGALPLAEFDIRCFKTVRQAMIGDGRVRNQVNRRAKMVRGFIRWCVEDGLPVAVGVLEKLSAVRPLAPGRDGAAEGEARMPADPTAVAKVLPLLRPPVAAIIRTLWLTGARPSEILKMKPCEIDRTGPIWELKPTRHKSSWRGKSRAVYIGPDAQTVLAPWLDKTPDPDDYVFSPARAHAEHNTERSAARKTKRWPSHMRRNATKRKGAARKRAPGAVYSHLTLSCAVRRACLKAGVAPFTPYTLRHLRAVELREQFGPDHVRAVLGHSALNMSDHYSRTADRALAMHAAERAG